MRVLLDSHSLLWSLEAPDRLPKGVLTLLMDGCIPVYVSIVTLWELQIKAGTGKLRLPPNLPDLIKASGFDLLGVAVHHVSQIGMLPLHHRDPFDRMLIAQAMADGMTLVTADRMATLYDVPVLWS